MEMLESLQNNEAALWWLVVSSVVVFVASLIAVPWLVIKLPPDHFAPKRRHRSLLSSDNPTFDIIIKVVRNIFGVAFILAGVLMLVLPGQGILAIVAGLTLMTFPGKRKLVRWIISRRVVLSSINSIRRRAGRKPLILDARPAQSL